MTITPNGSPPWVRTVSHVDYGGDTQKANYLSQGVIDALTDVGAEGFCRMVADLEALVRTAPFAVITYTCNDSSPAAPTIGTVYMMTGINVAGYAGASPPSGFPSAARQGNGDVEFTFAATYADAYGVTGAFAPLFAVANVQTSSSSHFATAGISGSTVRVRAFTDTGAAVSNPTVTLAVW